MTIFRLFQAFLRTYFLTLCFGVLASALLPKCLQKCGECMETVNNYDTRSCLSYCLDGKTDDQCNLFSVSAAKRGFGKRSLECKKFCFQCKLTYPQYNGNKCLEECEMSKGFKLDVNCINYWWKSRTFQTILVTVACFWSFRLLNFRGENFIRTRTLWMKRLKDDRMALLNISIMFKSCLIQTEKKNEKIRRKNFD